jgi:hypothetical protein
MRPALAYCVLSWPVGAATEQSVGIARSARVVELLESFLASQGDQIEALFRAVRSVKASRTTARSPRAVCANARPKPSRQHTEDASKKPCERFVQGPGRAASMYTEGDGSCIRGRRRSGHWRGAVVALVTSWAPRGVPSAGLRPVSHQWIAEHGLGPGQDSRR